MIAGASTFTEFFFMECDTFLDFPVGERRFFVLPATVPMLTDGISISRRGVGYGDSFVTKNETPLNFFNQSRVLFETEVGVASNLLTVHRKRINHQHLLF